MSTTMSSFLSNPSSDGTAVLLAALEPLWDKAPGGAASADAFLKSGADLEPIKAMLAALGVSSARMHVHAELRVG